MSIRGLQNGGLTPCPLFRGKIIQQQVELRQNTKVLELQAEELKKSVEQHKELVEVTREQVKAELKALEIDSIRALREAHPNFSVSHAGWKSKSANKKTYVITILNSGQAASSVRFTTKPSINQIEASSPVHYFEKGQKHDLKWETTTSGEAPVELKLVINCRDANTRPYTKTFDLVLNDEDHYDLVSTAEAS